MDLYGLWIYILFIVPYILIFFGTIGLFYASLFTLAPTLASKKIRFLGIIILYGGILWLIVYFTGEDFESYSNVFLAIYFPYLWLCFQSCHYLFKRPYKTKLKQLKEEEANTGKSNKEDIEDVEKDLDSADVISWSASLGAIVVIIIMSLKTRFIHNRELMYQTDINELIGDLAAVSGAVLMFSLGLALLYFIIDLTLWKKRGAYPGYILRPLVMGAWQIIFLISLIRF